MKVITKIESIRPELPDDLFVICASFEDRSLGSVTRLSGYNAKCTVVVNFLSDSNREGEKRKRETMEYLLKALQPVDFIRMPRLINVGPYNYHALIEQIDNELRLREIGRNNLHATIDISCFTKIQLLFLLKNLLQRKMSSRIRLLYTLPEHYHTSGDKFHRLSIGYYRPISVPFKTSRRNDIDILRRVAILQLGHEGERISSVWRKVEAAKIFLMRPTSDDEKLMKLTEKANDVLLCRARSGDPMFEEAECNRMDIDKAIHQIRSFCERERKNGNTLVSIIPFGPKPFAVASLLSALSLKNLAFEISYAIPTGYNNKYSEGIRETYEYDIEI